MPDGGVQDVEVPARVNAVGDRSARSAGLAGVREYRSVLVPVAFVVAVLLGVAIGYVTADRQSATVHAPQTATSPAPELTPALRTAPWEGARRPGTAHQMRVLDEPDPDALRLALSWTVADSIKAAGGASTISARQVTIVNGMYFGAVEGVDAAHDEYWAIGRIEVQGPATPPVDPHVWRRTGAGPWTIVRNGPRACDVLPRALITLWKVSPPPCTG